MAVYPKVKFYLNEQLDGEMGTGFFNLHKSGVSFSEKILRDHPTLKRAHKRNKKEQRNIILSYIGSFYRKHYKEIEETKREFQNGWNKNAKDFFLASDRSFANHSWPEGKYHAYLSIFNCNPRFLDTKTFQVFWRHPKPLAVVAHEMLHFLFYDYVERYFPKTKIKKEILWQLSEIVNSFVLAEPLFVEITKEPTPPLYRDLIPLAKELLPLWKESKNVPVFLHLSLTKTFDQEQGKRVRI